ncbi:MAG: arginase [Ignavibacteriae bacterium]|nr:arginase [Ignavibacteria bacterium]MBI3364842.1 arginase [Ignavibacteriota bacterium]
MTVHIIGVPMDLGAGRRGVDMGPSAIRIAGIGERLQELGYKVVDEGDLAIKTQEEQRIKDPHAKYLPEITRAVTVLSRKVERVLEQGHFPLVLGGDHSIAIGTISGVAAFARKRRKKIGVFWIDAHGDFNTPGTSPSGNVHGMPLAVCTGLGPRPLVNVGGSFTKVKPRNVAIIGLRNLDKGERRNLLKNGVRIFTMEEVDKFGIHKVMKNALQQVAKNVDYLHVSFDLDSVDPVYAPGVGTPVKGGLDYREAHLIMEMLAESKKMTSLEIVEVNPIVDNRNQSAEFAVELMQSAFGKKIL